MCSLAYVFYVAARMCFISLLLSCACMPDPVIWQNRRTMQNHVAHLNRGIDDELYVCLNVNTMPPSHSHAVHVPRISWNACCHFE